MLDLISSSPVSGLLEGEDKESALPFERWRNRRRLEAEVRRTGASACEACDRLTSTPRHRRCSTCSHRFHNDDADRVTKAICDGCGSTDVRVVHPFELRGSQAMLCNDCALLAAVISPSTVNGLRLFVGGGEGRTELSDDDKARRRRKADRRSSRRLANERRRARETWKQSRTLKSVLIQL